MDKQKLPFGGIGELGSNLREAAIEAGEITGQPYQDHHSYEANDIENLPIEAKKAYRYHPLDEDAKEIRLLTLFPASLSSDIRGRLDVVPLHDQPFPEFEALSYAWGTSPNLSSILIDTDTGFSSLLVSQSLAEALPYLRHNERTRALWIDAICIDQQDLAERSSQVQRMADIYSSAAKVVIWLGPGSEDSALGLRCIKRMGSKVTVDWGLQTMTATTEIGHWADIREKPYISDADGIAVYNVLNRNWFKRLWIWQEAWLAREAVVLCGTHSSVWQNVRSTVYMLNAKPFHSYVNDIITTADWISILSLCNQRERPQPLVEMLQYTKTCSCTDPRDKIFALFSLLRGWEQRSFPQPDYTKSTFYD